MIVHPPKTASGSEAKNAPIGGKSPARSMHTAPVIIAKRFTTFVIVISPIFWLKEVTGGQPKSPDKVLAKPSQAREPEISFSLTSRSRPVAQSAEVSPMVSAADTRKIMATETIAPT